VNNREDLLIADPLWRSGIEEEVGGGGGGLLYVLVKSSRTTLIYKSATRNTGKNPTIEIDQEIEQNLCLCRYYKKMESSMFFVIDEKRIGKHRKRCEG
jgi:hypothetical protein